jgi:hypothetical protein
MRKNASNLPQNNFVFMLLKQENLFSKDTPPNSHIMKTRIHKLSSIQSPRGVLSRGIKREFFVYAGFFSVAIVQFHFPCSGIPSHVDLNGIYISTGKDGYLGCDTM